jgi:hypothetical protein
MAELQTSISIDPTNPESFNAQNNGTCVRRVQRYSPASATSIALNVIMAPGYPRPAESAVQSPKAVPGFVKT